MLKKNKEIFEILEKMHPNAESELKYNSPFELLVAVVLSAQCTDKRVNQVTEKLFKVANTPEQLALMDIETLEKYIYSCGFYHSKAKSVKQLSQSIVENGGMPQTRDELEKLRGVGRKTANVVYSVALGGNAIAVDTHVFRVSNRLGIIDAKNPLDAEKQLQKAFDENLWSHLHHLLIFQGRYICKSQKPNCSECSLTKYCKYYKEIINK